MDPRPAPVVTVTDPSQPGRPPDLLVVAEPPVAPHPVRGRRRRRTAVALLLLTGVLAAGAELRERRAAEVAEGRLAGIVALGWGVRAAGAQVEPPGPARLTVTLRLWNSGPRPVTVVGASGGGFTAEDEVGVPPGGRGDLVLSTSAACPAERPAAGLDGAVMLVLDVRTGAGVQPYPLLAAGPEALAQACGWGPLPKAVHLVRHGDVDPGGALALQVGAATRAPVRLLALRSDPGSGLTVTAPELAAGPVLLPRWSPGKDAARALKAQVGILDCTAARTAAQARGADVMGVFEDVNGERAQVDLRLDADVLGPRLAAVCP